jgi:hypothetical protein
MSKISRFGNSVSSISINKNKKETKEKGSLRAFTASQVACLASLPISIAASTGMSKLNTKLTPDQLDKINKSADAMIDATKLRLKGVKIDNVTKAEFNPTNIPDCIYDLINTYNAVAKGKNAGFLNKDVINTITGEVLHNKNTIIANREKMATALFHEIGHAFNANKSIFWNTMQKVRTPAMAIGTGFAIFAATTKKAEAKDGQELTKMQKTKNFIRKNVK